MALFARNKKKDEVKEVTAATKAAAKAPAKNAAQTEAAAAPVALAHVLRNPRITEKATDLQGVSVYTFDVADTATKRQIIEAVRALYHVSPQKVAMLPVRKKQRRSMRTGKVGMSRGGKKAYVYLAKGETIAIH